MEKQPPPQPAATATYPRELTIKPVSHRDWEVWPSGDNSLSSLYYCHVGRGIGKSEQPNILVQSGGMGGPTVGASHHRSVGSIMCGLGADELSMNWWELQPAGGPRTFRYEFDWQGRQYALQGATGEDVGKPGRWISFGLQLKVVDVAAGRNVALSAPVKSTKMFSLGRPSRTLKLVEGLGAELEVLILLGVLSWENQKERSRED
ncbi:hypothetical protein BDY17DRAFT_81037 [Neohortaea acidophila]|uniref:Tubby C-terminal-like domain-containing protein n=1 Tax=Neohortaea acidophila TaxID=245834 RepID=A0A6A6Q2K5_9PEZI|nr:uncharacterized protein BDY17DRAFT_81037 [Neohortaea acidophila]KAF2486545.1 hypothetical protein BDY17DRAFT_81037 [Neohortaea acidophila]